MYREQKRLVKLGWATVVEEVVGGRSRNRYVITSDGEKALAGWMASEPGEPQLEIEGMLRLFHGSLASSEDLARSMRSTESAARAMIDDLAGFAAEYLGEGGPMWMIETGVGGPEARVEWHGRPMYPERLHVIAMVLDGTTALLGQLADFCAATAEEVGNHESPTSSSLSPATRKRLESVVARGRPPMS